MNPAENSILNQSEPYRSILLHLKAVIEHTIPSAQLVYKWRMPCFYLDGKKMFCYMHQSKDYVDLGFWNAAHFKKNTEYLVSEKRKRIKSLRYKTLEDINETILKEVLLEAYSLRDVKFYS